MFVLLHEHACNLMTPNAITGIRVSRLYVRTEVTHECGYFERFNKQNDLKHDTKHAGDCNRHIFVMI